MPRAASGARWRRRWPPAAPRSASPPARPTSSPRSPPSSPATTTCWSATSPTRPSTQAAIDGFVERAGGLELLVANAGITHYGPFRDQPLDKALQMSQVNWHGTLHTVHFGLPHLLRAGRGHIVVVSSGAGLRSFPQAAVYGATKAAQRMFAEALRHELAGTGVSLTTVYPGEIATSLHDHEKDRMPAWYRGGPDAAPPSELADRIVAAVEDDERSVYYPAARARAGARPRRQPQGRRRPAAPPARRQRRAAPRVAQRQPGRALARRLGAQRLRPARRGARARARGTRARPATAARWRRATKANVV